MVLIAGSSFIFALLLPVARDVAHSIDAARRSKIEKKAPSMSDDMASQPTAGMAATSQWGMFWIDLPRSEPPGGADDSSDVDVGVTRVR